MVQILYIFINLYILLEGKEKTEIMILLPLGPGSYGHKEFIGKESPKKTIDIKYNYNLSSNDIVTPGPGHYEQSNSNNYLHKNPNNKIKRITDLNDLRNENPGPGQYKDDITIKNILMKNPSWVIGSSKRKSLNPADKSYPGVGNYTIYGKIGAHHHIIQ